MDDVESSVAEVAGIAVVPTVLDVVCRTTGMGFAAVARVTEDRWIACSVRDEIRFGLKPGGELQIETTICNEIRAHEQVVVIDHVAEDKIYCHHPTPAMYGFQSYISVPIRRRDGAFFGTLCAIDPRPVKLATPETIGMFKLFADLIGLHLDAQDRIAASEAALLNERQAAELREQFIAVLGHDLRNPLAAIEAAVRLLQGSQADDSTLEVLRLIQSSTRRMARLISDVLDLTRGRLGGGLVVGHGSRQLLSPVLEGVIAELRAAWPRRAINTEIRLDRPVVCNAARIAQLLSNLLANALEHDAADTPVAVHASVQDGSFVLFVENAGDTIPPATMERLFQPFFRASTKPHSQGLGLGLYIASEVARGHGGTLHASSDAERTRFTLTMPAG